MITTAELRRRWENDEELRTEWKALTETRAWQAVSELVASEAVRMGTASNLSADDAILARNLVQVSGVLWVIEALQNRWMLPKTEEVKEDEAFSDEYAEAWQKKQLSQQQ